MKSQFFLSTLMLLFCGYLASAQTIEPREDAILQIRYEKTTNRDTVNNSFSPKSPMILRIGRTASMFYPEKLMYCDSMDYYRPDVRLISLEELITKGGFAIAKLKGYEDEYLFRDRNNNETLVWENFATYHIGYKEKTEFPDWTIHNDSTTLILGYECIAATCSYRGRQWKAWFTPEIPVNEGPWKLGGLPGLVLKAQDSRNHYLFEATSIRDSALPKVGIFNYKKKPLEMLKSRQEYLRALYNLQLKGKFMNEISLHTDFKPSKNDRIPLYDYLETDYPHK